MDLNDIFEEEKCMYCDSPVNNCLQGLSAPISSEESTRISLQSIREQRDGLNRHRQSILNRVPERETWCSFPLKAIEDKDLAYLSAATGDEFALLRGKNEDILYHGTPFHCHIEKSDLLMELLYSHKVELVIHTHPDYERMIPSTDDRAFLESIGQNKSKIISSYTGKIVEFTTNMFDDI